MPDRALTLLVPGDIDTKTGGYGYDREIVAGLTARGWSVSVLSVAGAYPLPSAQERAAAARALAQLPRETLVLADGLAFGALPDEVTRERPRLRFVALVHHPLGRETGLDALTSLRLLGGERYALASARGVVVTSPRTVEAVESLGVPSDRIAIVEPGTHAASVARGSSGGAVHLVCVASLVPRKGHDTLLAALQKLASIEWDLTCVGALDRDSSYAADIERRANEPPLKGRVHLVGELAGAALDAAYDAADLFVLPTHYEGYGMAVAEAIARGIPVVSTATGAIPELVGESGGVLVPPGDADALAGALEPLLTDPSRLSALKQGACGRRALVPTWETASERMEQALDRLGGA